MPFWTKLIITVAFLVVIAAILNLIGFNNVYDFILSTKKFTDAVVPVLALLIAALGLFTWRKQLKGNHTFKLATDIRAQVYDFLDEVRKFRRSTIISTDSELVQRNVTNFNKVTLSSSLLISLLNSSRVVMHEKSAINMIELVNKIINMQAIALTSLSLSARFSSEEEVANIFTAADRKVLVFDGSSNDPLNSLLNDLTKGTKNLTKPFVK